MEIYKVTIPKKAFLTLSEDEQVFLIQATRLHDELTMLDKLSVFIETHPKTKIDEKTTEFQLLFLIQIIMGYLRESWQLTEKQFKQSKNLNRKYYSKLSKEAKEAYEMLTKEFSQGSWITDARNQLIFHHIDPEPVLEAIATVHDDEGLEYYLDDTPGNSLFWTSHHLTLRSLIGVYAKHHREVRLEEVFKNFEQLQEVIKKMFKDLSRCGEAFLYFFRDVPRLMFEDWDAKGGVTLETLEIPEPPKMGEVKIPYFVSQG